MEAGEQAEGGADQARLGGARARRSDAELNAKRIVESAVSLLHSDSDVSVDEVAKNAGVSRATVYRHFASREALLKVARQRSRVLADANEVDSLRPAGELAGGPTALDVTDVLNKVPPHLLGDQIVAEAQRLAGVSSVALYLIDIDGGLLLRHAGSEEFPREIDAPFAVGPEIPREGLPVLEEALAELLPGSTLAPMLLRGRAVGILLATDAANGTLDELARQAAAAVALANAYTDVFDATRRRKETSAASEIQQNLLPPRIARIAGGVVSGNVLPGYDVGGDWFDYVENRDGAWLGVADSVGNGARAAAMGGVSLGAFRAKRRVDAELEDAALAIDRTMREVGIDDAVVNAILARWHGPSAMLTWIACGDQCPILIHPDNTLEPLDTTAHESLGRGPAQREFHRDRRRLQPDDRVLLLSDGVLERRTPDGGPFGIDGVRTAIATAGAGAAATVRAIEDALVEWSVEPLEDDATIVVFAPSGT